VKFCGVGILFKCAPSARGSILGGGNFRETPSKGEFPRRIKQKFREKFECKHMRLGFVLLRF